MGLKPLLEEGGRKKEEGRREEGKKGRREEGKKGRRKKKWMGLKAQSIVNEVRILIFNYINRYLQQSKIKSIIALLFINYLFLLCKDVACNVPTTYSLCVEEMLKDTKWVL
ncbi:hypothetical protein [Okeania sp. KiyG1]|uniref:hypothetical protein n=1 Tax=Okeania sp. KiyG1 TaxID=2720165 RepID=UPI0019226AFF|nr:hypothetical protein [Okeania sp. KiyG1]GGA20572.1 hypothetical protein CYANOKiyG1_35520 [Okeania sp. KiyG1]